MHTQPSTVLIIDDNATNVLLLSALAQTVAGSRPVTFEDPVEALGWCSCNMPDIVLVDYMMPGMDGLEFIRRFTSMAGRADVPIIMVTTENEKAIRHEALAIGATDFLAKPVDTIEFRTRVRNLLALRRSQKMLRDRAKLLQSEVECAVEQLVQSERDLIFCLGRAVEFRDSETGAHVLRMSHYSALIAKELLMPEEFQQMILLASPLHDVGKIGIPDHILLKPGPLDQEELTIMRRHAQIGERLLSESASPLVKLASEIAGSHHEKFDGTGYPRGLVGNAIPLAGRIVAVADVFDALTSRRPYKEAWTVEAARKFILERSGDHFCSLCVMAFFGAWSEILEIRDKFPDQEIAHEQLEPM
ncbi:MAG: HD domain-containing phosphohydrolase [Usitatibacteraceae bacterium]